MVPEGNLEPFSCASGNKCLAGTRKVPKNFKPCCKTFDVQTFACEYEVRISYYKNKWGIPILDGGTSYMNIKYCPFCGKKL